MSRFPVVLAPTLGVLLALGAPVHAQTTHLVGPGGFGQIDPAIRASSPGDTILITASGRYDHFTLDRGVTIRAAAGVRALVANALAAPSGRDTTMRVPAGQTAEIVGLLFVPETFFLAYRFIGRVRVSGGAIVFRDCWIDGQTNGCGAGWPALEVEDASVALQLCRVAGHDRDGVALQARRSAVSAFDSTFDGGEGCWDSYAFGADAIRLEASRMHASRIVVQGGSTPFLNPNYDAGHGIVVDPGSRLWLAHAIVRGGNGGPQQGRGGDGIHNLSTTPIEADRLTATGGSGTPPGVPIRGPLVANPRLLVAWANPVEASLGTMWTIHFQAAPGTPIVALAGLRVSLATAPGIAQPLWLAAHPAPIAWSTGIADPQGNASVPIAIPNLPALRGARLWFQGAGPAGLPLQLTPLLGGQIW